MAVPPVMMTRRVAVLPGEARRVAALPEVGVAVLPMVLPVVPGNGAAVPPVVVDGRVAVLLPVEAGRRAAMLPVEAGRRAAMLPARVTRRRLGS